MHGILKRIQCHFSQAPLSFGTICIGTGIVVGGILTGGLGIPTNVSDSVGMLIAFIGVLFFNANSKAGDKEKIAK